MRFSDVFIVPRFYSFSSAVHSRVLTVVDYRNDGVIDWEEFLCYKFILDHANREQRMKCAQAAPHRPAAHATSTPPLPSSLTLPVHCAVLLLLLLLLLQSCSTCST